MAKSMQCHLFHLGSCQVCLYLSRVGNLVLHTVSSFSERKVSIPLPASLPAPITSTTMSVFPFVSCLTPGTHLALCRPLNTKYNSSVGCWRAYCWRSLSTCWPLGIGLHPIPVGVQWALSQNLRVSVSPGVCAATVTSEIIQYLKVWLVGDGNSNFFTQMVQKLHAGNALFFHLTVTSSK